MGKYICTVCWHIYEAAKEGSKQNQLIMTELNDLPDDWVCQECGAPKNDLETVLQ